MIDLGYTVKLQPEQLTLFSKWLTTRPNPDETIGQEGSYRYKFIVVPTSIGDEITVVDMLTQDMLDLSMAEMW